ncbi:hypothetical protein LNAT_P1265 [Lebetimonas natsushimae]|uniref:Uncharacterized protein n=1 Tax=Lebetimonas natsushimae TaxID=1936991 RepID=A0A292YEK3_9BACT|nr:hypothetical protein [Lebetimonas natsushimae]GAX87968.1 hypothetical protein LNAT_P1265 [Lebetimonas natsushimae]
MKKIALILISTIISISCNIYFPSAVSVDSKKLFLINLKTSDNKKILYIDKNTQINSSNIGEIIVTKSNVKITFKFPFTKNSLTNIQKIKKIEDKTGSVTLIFKGGDYYIENLIVNDYDKQNSLKTTFKIKTPNNSRIFVKNCEIKNYKNTSFNVALNKNNYPNALLLYSLNNFKIDIKGQLLGNFYFYGYKDFYLKANPNSLVKGAIHIDGKFINDKVKIKYIKPKDMYKLVVCNTLPPRVNEKINNQTLLGIDVNNNGIRDDIERWVVKNYSKAKYSKVKIAIALQYAKAAQIIIKNPTYENSKYLDNAIDCQTYFESKKAKKLRLNGYQFIKFALKHDVITSKFRDIIFNTNKRLKQYFKYNEECSGHVFESNIDDPNVCVIDIDKLEE